MLYISYGSEVYRDNKDELQIQVLLSEDHTMELSNNYDKYKITLVTLARARAA